MELYLLFPHMPSSYNQPQGHFIYCVRPRAERNVACPKCRWTDGWVACLENRTGLREEVKELLPNVL
jgi:hypothetical protein